MVRLVGLTREERYLLHQVHPAKLGTDIGAAIVSTALFWRHRLVPGLLFYLGPPVITSSIVMRRDLAWVHDSPAGRYVLQSMPPSMQVVRALGAVVLAIGGWRRSPALVGAGVALAAVGWSRGLWPRPGNHSRRRRVPG